MNLAQFPHLRLPLSYLLAPTPRLVRWIDAPESVPATIPALLPDEQTTPRGLLALVPQLRPDNTMAHAQFLVDLRAVVTTLTGAEPHKERLYHPAAFDLFYAGGLLAFEYMHQPDLALHWLRWAYDVALLGAARGEPCRPYGISHTLPLAYEVRAGNRRAWHLEQAMGALETGWRVCLRAGRSAAEAHWWLRRFYDTNDRMHQTTRGLNQEWLAHDYALVAMQYGWYHTAAAIAERFSAEFPRADGQGMLGVAALLSSVIDTELNWGEAVQTEVARVAGEHLRSLREARAGQHDERQFLRTRMTTLIREWGRHYAGGGALVEPLGRVFNEALEVLGVAPAIS